MSFTDTVGGGGPPQQSGELGSSFGDAITQTVRAAPELYQAPSTALAAAGAPGDPATNAQALAQTGNLAAAQQAVNTVTQKAGHPDLLHEALGFFSHGVKDVLSAPGVTGTLHVLNSGLQLVQHDYRFLHDVYANKGAGPAMLVSLGLLGGGLLGAAAGTLVGDPLAGGMLGGAAATGLIGELGVKDSWDRTSSGANYEGGMVSPGRDLASGLADVTGWDSLRPAKGRINVMAGLGDAIFDLSADPLKNVGDLAKAGRLAAVTPQTAEDVVRIGENSSRFQRAADDIAQMGKGQILTTYAQQYSAILPIADELAAASTRQEVIDTFARGVDEHALSMASQPLPNMSLTRYLKSDLVDRLTPEAPSTQEILAGTGEGSGWGRLARSLNNKLATTYDADTQTLSNTRFSMTDPAHAPALKALLKYSMPDSWADRVVDDFYATNDIGQKKAILEGAFTRLVTLRGGSVEAGSQMAGRALQAVLNPDDVAQVRSNISSMLGGFDVGKSRVYGLGPGGVDVSGVTNGTSNFAGALRADQLSDDVTMPSFGQVKEFAARGRALKEALNGLDSFAYNHITQPFKALATFTAGFAGRIAMAEMLPRMMADGAFDLLKAGAASALARFGYEDAVRFPEQDASIASTVFGVLRHPVMAAERAAAGLAPDALLDSKAVQRSTDIIAGSGGDRVAGPLTAGYHIGGEYGPVERSQTTLNTLVDGVPKVRFKPGTGWGAFSRNEADALLPQRFSGAWQEWLSRIAHDDPAQAAAVAIRDAYQGGATPADATLAGQQAARQAIDNMPDTLRSRFMASQLVGVNADPLTDPLDDWARRITEDVKGATHSGTTLEPNMPILDALADAPRDVESYRTGALSQQALADVDPGMAPTHVIGQERLPDMTSTLSRVIAAGHRNVIDPMINYLSRQPIFHNAYYQARDVLDPLAEQGFTADEIHNEAMNRAARNMIPFIHNAYERTQFAEAVHNWFPFYFAQEQAYRRAGRLLLSDPGAFRGYQLAITGYASFGQQVADSNGNGYFAYPGSGFLSPKVIAAASQFGMPIAGSVPSAFSGRVQSLNVVFPANSTGSLLPNMGPIVTVGTHVIGAFHPQFQSDLNTLGGPFANQGSALSQLVPNTPLRDVMVGLSHGEGPFGFGQTAYNSTVMSTMQALVYHDEQNPAVKQWMAAKEANPNDDPSLPQAGPYPGNFLPPVGAVDDATKRAAINRVRNQTTIGFMLKALIAAVSPTGASLDVGDAGLKADLQNEIAAKGVSQGMFDFLAKNPDATAYTVSESTGQDGTTVPATAPAEDFIASHADLFRRYPAAAAWLIPQPATAGKFDQQVYNQEVAQGLRTRKMPDQFLNDLYVASGNAQYYNVELPDYQSALAAAKGNPAQTAAVRAAWSQTVQSIGLLNPEWWTDLTSGTRTVQRKEAVTQLQDIFDRGLAPDTPQSALVKGLLDDYNAYQRVLLPGVSAANGTTNTAVTSLWKQYMTQKMADEPSLAPIIQRVFMSAPVLARDANGNIVQSTDQQAA